MTLNSYRYYQLFKYAVYALLTLNIYLFFAEEWAASAHRFAGGISLGEVTEGFAATIDTAAWVVLLLIFELETWVLEDRHFTRRMAHTLHAIRIVCYLFIINTFYDGYLSKLLYLMSATPLSDINDLCSLVADQWAYAVDLDEYERLTFDNCASIAPVTQLMQFRGLSAVVDVDGYREIMLLAWVDVINSGVWLLVVAVLEIDVRLQEKGLLKGLLLRLSTISKYILYSLLFLAAVYWGIKGDFVDFWDAFLWLVAFVFIELNVFEWRQEAEAKTVSATAGSATRA